MARATRSSTQHHEKSKHLSPTSTSPPTSSAATTPATKKRKRQTGLTQDPSDDQPASKQLRTDQHQVSDQPSEPDSTSANGSSSLSFAGDRPLDSQYASKILRILQAADTQSLLDRVFPLPSDAPHNAQQQSQSVSLHTLFHQSSQHPLWVLRAAVNQLRPQPSQSRIRLSSQAIQQNEFCDLATSLLDQLSFHVAPIPLDTQSILPEDPADDADDSKSGLTAYPPSPEAQTKPCYALVQHLPNGDYWTSLNADLTALAIKDLPTANAELVSILPTSSSTLISPEKAPTLGSYNLSKPGAAGLKKAPLPAQRRLTTGSFLDYGTWASFAPSFEQDAELVGRRELGEVLWYRERRKWERTEAKRVRFQGIGSVEEIETSAQNGDVSVHTNGENIVEDHAAEVMASQPTASSTSSKPPGIDAALEELLSPEEAKSIKAALKTLELENAVHELLQRNSRALKRLEELQYERLISGNGDSGQPVEGSEEWDLAHHILDSLTVFASLRPRPSTAGKYVSEDTSPIRPSIHVLHRLHQALAIEPKPGWYGTLPATQTTALRDNTTVKTRPGIVSATPTSAPTNAAVSQTGATSVPTSATPTPTTATSATTTPYSGYPYYSSQAPNASQSHQAYRTPAATTTGAAYAYKPGQYYQGSYGTPQQTYYGQQGYAGTLGMGMTGQQPYGAYSNWYATYPQLAAAAANSGVAATAANTTASGRGTPQSPNPVATTAYGGYYNASTTPAAVASPLPVNAGATVTPPPVAIPQRTPVVANTVVMASQAAAAKPGTPGPPAAATAPSVTGPATGVSGYATGTTWGAPMGHNLGTMNMNMMSYGQMVAGTQGQGGQQQAGGVPTLPVHLRVGQQQQSSYYGAYQHQAPQ